METVAERTLIVESSDGHFPIPAAFLPLNTLRIPENLEITANATSWNGDLLCAALFMFERTGEPLQVDGRIIREEDLMCRIEFVVSATWFEQNRALLDSLRWNHPRINKYQFFQHSRIVETEKGLYKHAYFDAVLQIMQQHNPAIREEDLIRNPLMTEIADIQIDREGLLEMVHQGRTELIDEGELFLRILAEDVEVNLPILQELFNRM
jgi:hypothetical protein